jgi:hypothetical protein
LWSVSAMTPARDRSAMTSPMSRLTADDAVRALYIDFEGNKDQPPILLGCTRKFKGDPAHVVTHVVTDPAFASLAAADGLKVASLGDAVEGIIQRAEPKDRRIVAWSQHELDVVREHCPQHLDRFAARYVNARSVAEYWRNACHDRVKPDINKLAWYLDVVGWVVPEHAGPDRTGETIRIVREALERGRSATELTDNQRRRWRDLLDHNRHDCMGMRRVTVTATRELAQRAERLPRRRAERAELRVAGGVTGALASHGA